MRRRAAALSLACSTGDEGKWCCRRCAPHDRPPREEDAPPPPKRRKKGAGAKVTDIKKTKHPKPHPDRKFKAKSIETPAVYCRHEGPCTLENCECLQADQYCSKFCGCFVPKVPPRPRAVAAPWYDCLLYTSPSPRDRSLTRMPSSA